MTRKNKLISTLFFLSWSFISLAQGETPIGLKLGISSTNLNGSDVSRLSNNGTPSSAFGFHFGIVVNSKMKRNFWLKSEVLYQQKNVSLYKTGVSGIHYSSKFKSQYIEVYPISPTIQWKGLQLLVGPYVSMLLNSTSQDSSGRSISVFGSSTSLSSYRQKIDVGIVLGLDYQVFEKIFIGVRYTQGYIPLFENAAAQVVNVGSPTQTQKVYFNSLNFSVGFMLSKRKKQEPKLNLFHLDQ